MPAKWETLDAFFDQVLDAIRAEGVPLELTRKLASSKGPPLTLVFLQWQRRKFSQSTMPFMHLG
jgi:hypothetical protein